jgi:hypothetical protein
MDKIGCLRHFDTSTVYKGTSIVDRLGVCQLLIFSPFVIDDPADLSGTDAIQGRQILLLALTGTVECADFADGGGIQLLLHYRTLTKYFVNVNEKFRHSLAPPRAPINSKKRNAICVAHLL